MKFFIDNCISYRIAYSLAPLIELEGHKIVPLRDKFEVGAKDRDWLPELQAEGGWIVVTADLGRKDGDRQVWLSSGLTVFFLAPAWTRGGHRLIELSHRFLKYWPSMAAKAAECPEGSCFDVSIQGRITKVRRR